MPKAKRKKNALGIFGSKPGFFSTSTHYPVAGHYGTYKRKKAGKAAEHDSKYDDVAKSLAGKPYKSLSSTQQATVRGIASKMNPRRKRNIELGLPSNKFVNAKVRMKGNKVQVMVDERLLGRVGASGGVSVNPKRKRNASALREIGTWKIEQRWKFAPSVAPKKLAKLIRADGGEVKVVRGGVNYRARSK